MALVNALQNNSPEMFNQPQVDATSRFMKIRSIWPFTVRGEQPAKADSGLPAEDDEESVAPSSFVT
jgi:hypothetical protein